MKIENNFSTIHVRNLNLWAHVGVLDSERKYGQRFLLDISLWGDFNKAAELDDLSMTIDYSFIIKRIQKLSIEINCMTIEFFSERILEVIEEMYGSIPMRICLYKCSPPVNGFTGDVSIERTRYFDSLYK